MLVQLGLEALKQREGIGRTAGKASKNATLIQAANFLAVALITILPSVTCPSPPMATTLPRRTDRIVVP